MVRITGHRRRHGVIIQPREASQERSGSQTKHNPWGGLQFYNRFKRVLDFPFFCVSYDMIYVNCKLTVLKSLRIPKNTLFYESHIVFIKDHFSQFSELQEKVFSGF